MGLTLYRTEMAAEILKEVKNNMDLLSLQIAELQYHETNESSMRKQLEELKDENTALKTQLQAFQDSEMERFAFKRAHVMEQIKIENPLRMEMVRLQNKVALLTKENQSLKTITAPFISMPNGNPDRTG